MQYLIIPKVFYEGIDAKMYMQLLQAVQQGQKKREKRTKETLPAKLIRLVPTPPPHLIRNPTLEYPRSNILWRFLLRLGMYSLYVDQLYQTGPWFVLTIFTFYLIYLKNNCSGGLVVGLHPIRINQILIRTMLH